ncbi:hypothetical protein [Streptosporangium canum]|uniref:hypothetical protein n=1 Tax=Streptosporangium canum TaxID=324952 RepID=UPI001160DF54|nr:hypothetical protein [Streptosporangium canum]
MSRGQRRSGAVSRGRASARHARRGSFTGWGGLAWLVTEAAAHPVIDVAITRPALARGGGR